MDKRIKDPPLRTGLCDAHRRDLEMILIGIAFAGSQQTREEIAVELGSSDVGTGGTLSKESDILISAISKKDFVVIYNWLAERGVVLERKLSVREAITERLSKVAELGRMRSLCKRLVGFELLDAETIVKLAAEIVKAGGQQQIASNDYAMEPEHAK